MIAAALSLIPEAWVEECLADLSLQIPPLRLCDFSVLDRSNLRSLLEAIAIEADHPEVMG